MKRMICVLLVLTILTGCTRQIIQPGSNEKEAILASTPTVQPAATPSPMAATPEPTKTPRPVLPTFAPVPTQEARFSEELVLPDGEPIGSLIRSLLGSESLTKGTFYDRFLEIIDRVDELESGLLRLSNEGRTLTADRKVKTIDAFTELMSREMLDPIRAAYSACPGEGEELPLARYSASVDALVKDLQRMEDRTCPFFGLDKDAAKEYKTVLERYMGEAVVPRALFDSLEELAQTEAYAIASALQADPEAVRKKEHISFGSFAQNVSFLCRVTEELCPLPDGSALPVPHETEAMGEMDLMELAFHLYPGMAFFKLYASRSPEEQQARWANAPDGYLAGLAVHCSYAVVPYLDDFGLDYVQYKWYEDMLDVTLTGISALLIHYYGYCQRDLADYLKSWGAESFAGYLYEKAMSDPFESLVASYGYWQYLEICQAALDTGCPSEQQFLQDYLKAGPAPFDALKEHMVALYQNQG